MIKRFLILALLFISYNTLIGQTERVFSGNVTFQTFTGSDSLYTGTLRFNDQTNTYYADSILVGDIVVRFDALRYEVDSILYQSLFSAIVRLKSIGHDYSPTGRGQISRDIGYGVQAITPLTNSGLSEQAYSIVNTDNLIKIVEALRSAALTETDPVFQDSLPGLRADISANSGLTLQQVTDNGNSTSNSIILTSPDSKGTRLVTRKRLSTADFLAIETDLSVYENASFFQATISIYPYVPEVSNLTSGKLIIGGLLNNGSVLNVQANSVGSFQWVDNVQIAKKDSSLVIILGDTSYNTTYEYHLELLTSRSDFSEVSLIATTDLSSYNIITTKGRGISFSPGTVNFSNTERAFSIANTLGTASDEVGFSMIPGTSIDINITDFSGRVGSVISSKRGEGLRFYTASNSWDNPTVKMKILNNGNVGINTSTTPSYTLDVNGTFRTTGTNTFESVANDNTITKIAGINSADELVYRDFSDFDLQAITDNGNTTSNNFQFTHPNSTIFFRGTNTFIGESSNTQTLHLRGGGSTVNQTVYLNPTGNLGIGIFPSFKLDVNGTFRTTGTNTFESVANNNFNTKILSLSPTDEVEYTDDAAIGGSNMTTNYLPYWDGNSWESSPLLRHSATQLRGDNGAQIYLSGYTTINYANGSTDAALNLGTRHLSGEKWGRGLGNLFAINHELALNTLGTKYGMASISTRAWNETVSLNEYPWIDEVTDVPSIAGLVMLTGDVNNSHTDIGIVNHVLTRTSSLRNRTWVAAIENNVQSEAGEWGVNSNYQTYFYGVRNTIDLSNTDFQITRVDAAPFKVYGTTNYISAFDARDTLVAAGDPHYGEVYGERTIINNDHITYGNYIQINQDTTNTQQYGLYVDMNTESNNSIAAYLNGDLTTTGTNTFESVANDNTATKITALNDSDEIVYVDRTTMEEPFLKGFNQSNIDLGAIPYGVSGDDGGNGYFTHNARFFGRYGNNTDGGGINIGTSFEPIGQAQLVIGSRVWKDSANYQGYLGRWPLLKLGESYSGSSSGLLGLNFSAPKFMIGDNYERPSKFYYISQYIYNDVGNQQYGAVGILNISVPRTGTFAGNVYGHDYSYVSRPHFENSNIVSNKESTYGVYYKGYGYYADWDYSDIDSISRTSAGDVFGHNTFAYNARMRGVANQGTNSIQSLYGFYADVQGTFSNNYAFYAENGDSYLNGDLTTTGTNTFESVANDNTITKIAGINSTDELVYRDISNLLNSNNNANPLKYVYRTGSTWESSLLGPDNLALSTNNNVWLGTTPISTTGWQDNTAIGVSAMQQSTAQNSTAVGHIALRYASGDYNAAFGENALGNTTTGTQNTALGYGSMRYNVSGSYNTVIGSDALNQNLSGNFNIAIGIRSGAFVALDLSAPVEKADQSIFIGNYASPKADSSVNEIVLGYQANGNGSNTVTLGNGSVSSLHSGNYNFNVDQSTTGLDGYQLTYNESTDEIELTDTHINAVDTVIASSTAATLDFQNASQKVICVDMTSASTASTVTFTISNIAQAGVYTIFLINTDPGGHDVDYPTNVLAEDGTAFDGSTTISYTADKFHTFLSIAGNLYAKF